MTSTELTRSKGTDQQRHAQMLINGRWVDGASGEVLAVENPAKRSTIASVPRGRAEDVDRAVVAAENAFPNWRNVPPRQRGRLLLRIAEALEARIEELARVIAEETGNALRTQARPEATLSADIFRYFGGLAGGTGSRDPERLRTQPLRAVDAFRRWARL